MNPRCGTRAGYERHRREKSVPCDRCLDANRIYMKTYRVTTGAITSIAVPIDVIGAALAGDLGPLRMALGPEMVEAIGHRMALEESRLRRDAETLAAVAEIVDRLDAPPPPDTDAVWSALHNEPECRDSADTHIY